MNCWLHCGQLLTLVLALSCTAAPGQTFTFPPHPRLTYLLPEAFTEEFAAMDAAAKHTKWATLIQRAQKIIADPPVIPSVGGQWIFYYSCPQHNCSLQYRDGQHVCPQCGKIYDDEQTRLAHVTKRYNAIDRNCLLLAKAWHITQRDEFAAEVYRVLKHYAQVYPGLPRHDRWGRTGLLATIGGKRFCQSLDEAYNIITLSEAYDLVYNWKGITAAERRQIEQDFFIETYKCLTYITMPHTKNNHTTWFNAGIAAIGAVLGREDYLQRAINGRRGLHWQFKNSVTDEGFWYEGTIAYHYYALQAVIATVKIAHACGLDLTDNPILKKLFQAPLQLAYPNGQLPAFNDGDRASLNGYRHLYDFASQAWNDPQLQAFAATGKVDQLDSAVYPGAGLAYLRRGSGDQAVTAILDYGEHGGHHGHPDKLNLMLYAHGGELFLDPGRLTYRCPEHITWSRQTAAHNTVAVDQQSQAPVAGRLLEFKRGHGAGWDIVAAEAANNYPGVVMRRALAMNDSLLIDCFAVQADRKVTADWFLHGTAKLTGPAVEQTAERPEPLHDDAGYQHLTELRQAVLQPPLHFDWLRQAGVVRTHLWTPVAAKLVIGNGIGYELTQAVPFVMVRQQGRQALWIAVHDLRGDQQVQIEVEHASAAAALAFTVGVDNHWQWRVQWEHGGSGKLKVIHAAD